VGRAVGPRRKRPVTPDAAAKAPFGNSPPLRVPVPADGVDYRYHRREIGGRGETHVRDLHAAVAHHCIVGFAKADTRGFGDGLGPVLQGLVREAHDQLRVGRRNGTPAERRTVKLLDRFGGTGSVPYQACADE
jgi:hypothetical protein